MYCKCDKFIDDDDCNVDYGNDNNDDGDEENDDYDDDDEKEVSLTEWVPSLSLTDRLLMSCLHQSLIKLSLIYGGGDDLNDDDYDVDEVERNDDHRHHHR